MLSSMQHTSLKHDSRGVWVSASAVAKSCSTNMKFVIISQDLYSALRGSASATGSETLVMSVLMTFESTFQIGMLWFSGKM